MSLIASLFEVKENETGLYRENADDLAYFHNDWFIHNFFKERFPDFIDKTGEFNGVEFEITKDMLLDLHKQMCDKLYSEQLDLYLSEVDETISQGNIYQIKQTIQFMNDNPTAMVYYEGGY